MTGNRQCVSVLTSAEHSGISFIVIIIADRHAITSEKRMAGAGETSVRYPEACALEIQHPKDFHFRRGIGAGPRLHFQGRGRVTRHGLEV